VEGQGQPAELRGKLPHSVVAGVCRSPTPVRDLGLELQHTGTLIERADLHGAPVIAELQAGVPAGDRYGGTGQTADELRRHLGAGRVVDVLNVDKRVRGSQRACEGRLRCLPGSLELPYEVVRWRRAARLEREPELASSELGHVCPGEVLDKPRLPHTRHPVDGAHAGSALGALCRKEGCLERRQLGLAADEHALGLRVELDLLADLLRLAQLRRPAEVAAVGAPIEPAGLVPTGAVAPSAEVNAVDQRTRLVVQLDLDEVVLAGPAIALVALIETAGGDDARLVPGLDVVRDRGRVLVAVEDEIDALREPQPCVALIGEPAQRVMDQGQPEAVQRGAAVVRGQHVDLCSGEQQFALVVFAPAQPGGVEPDDVDGVAEVERDTIAEAAVGVGLGVEVGAAHFGRDPMPESGGATEDASAPELVGPEWRLGAGHPSRQARLVGGGELEGSRMGCLASLAVHIMVPRHREEPIAADAGGGEDGVDALGREVVLLAEAPVGHIAGEADEIDAIGPTEFADGVDEVAFENAMAAGRMGADLELAALGHPVKGNALVQVRQVEDAEGAQRGSAPWSSSCVPRGGF